VSPESGTVPQELRRAASFDRMPVAPFPWFDAPVFAAAAEVPRVEAPNWTVLEESASSGRRGGRARGASRGGAPAGVLAFSPGATPDSVRISGQSLPEIYPRLARKLGGWRVYSCLTVPPEGVEVELARAEGPPVTILLADQSPGLPPGGERLAASRPATAVTSQFGDISVVARRVRF